ncbi:MAG: branched-chain amino acid ABC transporter permease [Minwuia sp.]|uniref:branched-chain amino acid ABC transporter permease n=1 Tax=Minwuia sp. TaxID=2493630 RepID=UPI003A8B2F21
MNWILLIEQMLNGVQLGLLLFLLAAGLTLVFGIMDLVNLAHGSLYMIGAFIAASLTELTGSFVVAALLTLPATMIVGMAVEMIALRTLYDRDHLDQVLATFGLILFADDFVQLAWGPAGMTISLPDFLRTSFEILPGVIYPTYRLAIIIVGLSVAAFLYVLVAKTRIGMLIRAGASNREMIGALGVNIRMLFTLIFGLGAAMAGLAGLMAGPILTVQIGMGNEILILAFVVIVIGGIGSIRGAFVAALIVGLIDTVGRAFLPEILSLFLDQLTADTAAPSISSMMSYLLMAVILAFRPEGLFPPRSG